MKDIIYKTSSNIRSIRTKNSLITSDRLGRLDTMAAHRRGKQWRRPARALFNTKLTPRSNRLTRTLVDLFQLLIGIGKTRLLDEIVILSQNIDPDLHVVNIATSYDIMKDNFKIVRIIIEELLGIIESPNREIDSFASTEILEVLKGILIIIKITVSNTRL